MAKRFVDSGLFDDQWFSELSKDGKIFWVYFITKCDHAGLLRLNVKLVQFQTGINSLATVIKELGNCLVTVRQDLLFCPKYLKFQYPDFPKSNVKQQEGAINLLKREGLWNEESNSYLTVAKELPNSYVNDNDNVDSINVIKINTIKTNVAENFDKFWVEYPRKKSKGDAEKAWKSINPQNGLVEKIIESVKKARETIEWKKENGQFIPFPATWLRARGWEDEITQVFAQPLNNEPNEW